MSEPAKISGDVIALAAVLRQGYVRLDADECVVKRELLGTADAVIRMYMATASFPPDKSLIDFLAVLRAAASGDGK